MKEPIRTRISENWIRLKRWLKLVLRRFSSQKILAVYDDDLDGVLKKMGLYEDIKIGKYKCKSCNCLITRQNLGLIKNENGAIQIYCISTGCKGG